MEYCMKKALVLLQIFGLIGTSFQYCEIYRNKEWLQIIDKWWTIRQYEKLLNNGYNKELICPDADLASIYLDDKDIIREYDNVALIVGKTETPILSFGCHNSSCSFIHGIKINNTFSGSIKADIFINLGELKEINLKQNTISSLPDRLFTANTKLRTIDLSYNNISLVGNTTFCINSLRNLNLKHNRLHNLTFKLPNTLISLELSSNLLSHIPQGFFFGMSALTTLSLEDNNLTTFPVGCFKDLKQLQVLLLAHNRINSFPPFDMFSGLNSLRDLNFANNSLQDLTALLTRSLDNLVDLNIAENNISVFNVQEITTVLRRLRTIDISGKVFNCSYLKKLFAAFAEERISIKGGNEHFNSNIKGIACKQVVNLDVEKTSTDSKNSLLKENALKFNADFNRIFIDIENIMYTCSVFLILIFILLLLISINFAFSCVQQYWNQRKVVSVETHNL